MAEADLAEAYLDDFKEVYSLAVPRDLEVQTPYLAVLAKHYEEKGTENPRQNWTDILKAHTLYNSCAVRDTSGKWREDAFRVQQLYWGNEVNTTYQTQTEMTESLMSELKYIRGLCKRCLTSPSAEIEKCESDIEKLNQMGDSGIYRETNIFVKNMKIVSNICNDSMLKLAQLCVKKAVALCGSSPCKFAAVSLGSMARGEVTPYSDWEFLFLISEETPKTVAYFELLAMTCYFIIGNLGETNLKYMNITELKGWFEDCAKNGFKIDGLQDCAGNIPTGNGSICQHNKFILTPEKLKISYAHVSEKPITEEALKGDLTAMLASTRLVYGDGSLLDEFESFRDDQEPNLERLMVTLEMLDQDLRRYEGAIRDHRRIDIKKEIYRYITLFLLNMKILFQARSSNSWDVIQELQGKGILQPMLESSVKFMLSAALFIRLSMYLHYDSQHDQLPLSNESDEPGKRNHWSLPFSLHLYLIMHLAAVQARFPNICYHKLVSFISSTVADGHSMQQIPLQHIVKLMLNNPICKPIRLQPLRAGIGLYGLMGKIEDSEKHITLSMKALKSEEDAPPWLNLIKTVLLYARQEYQKVINSSKCYLRSTNVRTDQILKMHFELLLCNSYLRLKNRKACVSYARFYSSKFIKECSRNHTEASASLFIWADINAQIDREDQAEDMYQKALKLAKLTNNYSCQLNILHGLMLLYRSKDLLSKATEAAQETLTLLTNVDLHADDDMIMKDGWARVVMMEGSIDKSSSKEKLRMTLEGSHSTLSYQLKYCRDLHLLMKTFRQPAIIHMKLEEYDRALVLLELIYMVIMFKTLVAPGTADFADELELCLTDMTTCLLLSGEVELGAQMYQYSRFIAGV